MRILYDGVYNSNPRSGIHRYFYNIIANMPDDLLKYSSTTVSRSNITNHFIPPFNHFRPHRMSYLLEYVWFRKQCYKRNFDLVHSSYYNLSKACLHLISSGVPHIITVHDFSAMKQFINCIHMVTNINPISNILTITKNG